MFGEEKLKFNKFLKRKKRHKIFLHKVKSSLMYFFTLEGMKLSTFSLRGNGICFQVLQQHS